MFALNRITVGVVLLLLMLFVYVSSDFIYGPYASMVRNVMIVYFILFIFMMSAFKTGMPLIGTSLIEMSSFSIGFIATAVVLLFLPLKGMSGEISMTAIKMALGFGVLHGFIKAYIEESVFRDILLKRLGVMASNILFGMFHIGMIIMALTALKMPVTVLSVGVPVAILTGLGFVWAFMAQRFGLMSAVGSHLAYNLKAFGVLERLI